MTRPRKPSRRRPERDIGRAEPLSLEELEAWLDKSQPRAPAAGVSMIDGFLAGLIVGPSFVHPAEWLFHVMGPHEKLAFAGSTEDAVIQTVVQRYNEISATLAERPGDYAPIFMRYDDGEVSAEDWANGFWGAMRLRLSDWAPYLKDWDTGGSALTLILANCTAPDGKPIYGELPAKVPPQAVRDAWRVIPDAVLLLRELCMPARVAEAKA